MTQEEYLENGKYIWKNFVPKSGQAEFVQGELLRAIEKLRDEAQRNGNGNFNEKCHGILVSYLREKLSDNELFDNKTIKMLRKIFTISFFILLTSIGYAQSEKIKIKANNLNVSNYLK